MPNGGKFQGFHLYSVNDWGITADTVCYQKLDDNLSCINAELEQLNTEVDAIIVLPQLKPMFLRNQ